jgi:transmembrane sensor
MAARRAHAAAEKPKRIVTWKTIAVTVAIVLLAAIATFLFMGTRGRNSLTVTVVPYSTLRTQLKSEQFPDGSQLDLDADSIVVGRFGAAGRQVQLQRGRAMFTVAADRARPFVVTAAGRSIIAVGTRFDVDMLDSGLTVTLLEGHVVIESKQPSQPLVLEPGQQYVERRGKVVVRTMGEAAENAAAWRSGLAFFDDQPLADVVQIMNRYSLQDIVVRDPAVAALRISGQFRAGDASGFAAKLASAYSLKVVNTGGRIELTRG